MRKAWRPSSRSAESDPKARPNKRDLSRNRHSSKIQTRSASVASTLFASSNFLTASLTVVGFAMLTKYDVHNRYILSIELTLLPMIMHSSVSTEDKADKLIPTLRQIPQARASGLDKVEWVTNYTRV